jgi:serine/threonine protein kinase
VSDARSERTRIISGEPTAMGHDAPPPSPTAPPAIPDVVIEAELGRGGMGVVYKGRQGYINRPVAVKLLLHSGGADGGEYVRRFQREATLLAGLNHPHIVACYQAGVTADNHCYLVMEYLDGPNLWQHVQKHGPLAEGDALGVVRAIAAALEYARGKGIIHRDVKAENILLAPSGEGGSFPYIAKLVDLGLARPVKPAGDMSLTRQGLLLGTPATMAPEQFDDPEGIDHRADIYGLGCALFQSVTGQPAYAGNSLAQIVADKVSGDIPDPRKTRSGLSRGTSDIVAWMLAKRREERPQSYADLIARVEQVLAGGGAAAKRPPLPLLIGVAGAVALAIGVGIALNRGSAPPPSVAAPVTAAPAGKPQVAVGAPPADPAPVSTPVAPAQAIV